MNITKSKKTLKTKRVPVSGHRDIMTVKGQDPDYVYRWVNDIDNRIERFKEGGYETVAQEVEIGERTVNSSEAPSSTISKKVGQGITAYLMKIKREWKEEDRNAKLRAIAETEADMKRTLNSGQNGTYGKVDFENK